MPTASWLRCSLLAMVALPFVHGALILPWRHLLAHEADFGSYYQAASALRQGLSPYTVHAFDYPPLPAFLVAPLAALPYEEARQAWLLFGQICLLAAAWLTWRALGKGWGALLAVAGVWGVAGTMTANLVLGQVHPLLLLLLAACFAFLGARPALAGVWVGVAAALKLWPAALLAALVGARQLRSAVAGALVAVLLVVVPGLVLWLGFPPPYVPTSTGYWMGTPAPLNSSLPAVTLRALDPPIVGERMPGSWRHGDHPAGLQLGTAHRVAALATALATLSLGGAALAWAGGVWRRSPGGGACQKERDLLLLGGAISLVLLASPISWYHYQIFQVLPAAVLAHRWLRRGAVWRLVGLGLLLAAVTRLPPRGFGAYVERFGWEASSPLLLWLATTTGPVLAIAFFAVVLGELRGTRRPPGETPFLSARGADLAHP